MRDDRSEGPRSIPGQAAQHQLTPDASQWSMVTPAGDDDLLTSDPRRFIFEILIMIYYS